MAMFISLCASAKSGDLIVPTLRQTLLFQVVPGIQVVYVTPVKDKVPNFDVARQKTQVVEFHLGRLVSKEVGT